VIRLINPGEGVRTDHFRGDCLRCDGLGPPAPNGEYAGRCACRNGWWGGDIKDNFCAPAANKYNGRWISSNQYKCNQIRVRFAVISK